MAITYTDEFKLNVIAESLNVKTAKEIFVEAGFDSEIIGRRRIDSNISRWKKNYNELGVMGLQDTRRENSGRPRSHESTVEEHLAKKNIEIEYLRAEFELVKKLELDERQVRNNKLNASYIFKIIHEIMNNHNLSASIRHLCDIAGVSRSGYYNYHHNLNSRMKQE